MTAASVAPYLRGLAFDAGAGVAYPRADPSDIGRLPADTWGTATLPVGVRIELIGDATAIEIDYTTRTDDLGYRGTGAGTTFTAWAAGEQVDEQPAVLGAGTARLRASAGGARQIVYLPEGMQPTIHAVRGVDGSIEPAPPQPRWIAYGDSILEGWIASGPARCWAALAGRTHGLDLVNMGYAGSARGELVSAEHIASMASPAVISITHGTNCWTRIPHSAQQMYANTIAFLQIVRTGHPDVPIVVATPIVRPDGESTPNKLGATHADIREAMRAAVQQVIADGDPLVTLLDGSAVVAPELLGDGVHPNDDGHAAMARVFGNAVARAADLLTT